LGHGPLTPTEVQAGQTTPTCGVTNGTPPPPPPGAANITTINGNTAAGKAVSTGATAGGSGSGAGGSGGGSGSGADPSVSLASTALPSTGSNPLPLVVIGVLLVAAGWIGRRRLHKDRRIGGPS